MWSTAEVRPGENLEAFPSFTPTKRTGVCLPCGNQGLSCGQVERDSLWDQENVVQSKNGMMPKVENTELNGTSRPHVQVVLNELGCHPLGGRLGHVFWETAPEDTLSCANNVGVLSKWGTTCLCCYSVTKSCLSLCDPTNQYTRLLCPSPIPGACSNSCPLSW